MTPARPARGGQRGRATLGLLAQLLHQGQDGRVGWGTKLLLDVRLVRPRVLDRGGRLSRRHEGHHQAECGPRAERVDLSEAAPPFFRRAVVPTRSGMIRELLVRFAHHPCDPSALGLDPALEIVRASQIEAVEERAAVQRHRTG